MKIFKLKIIIFCLLILAACAEPKKIYFYKNQQYSSPDEVIKKVEAEYAEKLKQIKPNDKVVDAKAIVFIPSSNLIRQFTLKLSKSLSDPVLEEQNLRINKIELDGLMEGLKKRRIFKEIEIIKFNSYDEIGAKGYDVIIYPDLKENWWVYKSIKANDTINIPIDKTLQSDQAYYGFLDNVDKVTIKQFNKK